MNSFSLEDGTAEIKEYKGRAETLEVPSELNGKSVTAIETGAFKYLSNLTNVSIPDSVIAMGINPFFSCEKLESIRVSPDHPYLATVNGALCSKPDNRLICYPHALAADSYEIPMGINAIGDLAFFDCSNLKSVLIPSSVTSIGFRAFGFCSGLIEITIPEGVETIGSSAFSFCSSLKKIAFSDSVVSVVDNPFVGCDIVESIQVSPDHPYLATIDGVLFSKPDKRLICYPCALDAVSYEIPMGIKAIGEYAFYDSDLKYITIPNSVTSIEAGAFFLCKNLTDITIPDSVTSIGEGAFCRCRNLLGITIPDNVASIGEDAFAECDNLTITVDRDSYAKQYCEEHNLKYTYPDADDWLNAP